MNPHAGHISTDVARLNSQNPFHTRSIGMVTQKHVCIQIIGLTHSLFAVIVDLAVFQAHIGMEKMDMILTFAEWEILDQKEKIVFIIDQLDFFDHHRFNFRKDESQ